MDSIVLTPISISPKQDYAEFLHDQQVTEENDGAGAGELNADDSNYYLLNMISNSCIKWFTYIIYNFHHAHFTEEESEVESKFRHGLADCITQAWLLCAVPLWDHL